jgi:hypothetical protein
VCTLILGVDVVAPHSLLLAANRDEDPARPSDPPAVLRDSPRVVGGRDRVAGGTWLAVVERRRVVAILNRRDPAAGPAPAPRRSRGLLALDVALNDLDPVDSIAAEVRSVSYAPFSMVLGSPGHALLLTHEGGNREPRVTTIPPGWHVITHADLDDPDEPRTAWLLGELSGFAPDTRAEAERRAEELLAIHAGAAPAVCIHEGRMVTVSSSRVWLSEDEAGYAHAEGRPCTTRYFDHSDLLVGSAGRRSMTGRA